MWRLALLAAHAAALRAPASLASLGRAAALRAAENDNPDFLEQNLGDASTAGESKAFKPFLHPLAGVSVSPRGFVAVLASPQTDGAAQRALPVVIHRADVDRIRSPYALAFLQLIQGIDVATAAILPPDALQKHRAAVLFDHVKPQFAGVVPGRRVASNSGRGLDAVIWNGEPLRVLRCDLVAKFL